MDKREFQYATIVMVALGMMGLYLHIPFSGWILFIGIIGFMFG